MAKKVPPKGKKVPPWLKKKGQEDEEKPMPKGKKTPPKKGGKKGC